MLPPETTATTFPVPARPLNAAAIALANNASGIRKRRTDIRFSESKGAVPGALVMGQSRNRSRFRRATLPVDFSRVARGGLICEPGHRVVLTLELGRFEPGVVAPTADGGTA